MNPISIGLLIEGMLMGLVIGLTLALLIWMFLPAFDAGQQTNQAKDQVGKERWHRQQMSRTTPRPAIEAFGSAVARNHVKREEREFHDVRNAEHSRSIVFGGIATRDQW